MTLPSSLRKICIRCAFITLGLILGLFLCEVVLRIMGYRGMPRINLITHDDILGWVGTPYAKGNYDKSCFQSYITLNSQGFRDKEHSLVKPRGIFRIAVVGDSFVEAREVPLEKTFWSVLQDKLDLLAQGRYEVMAFSGSAYGMTQEYILIREKVLSYSPDLIILAFYPGNDIVDVSLPMLQATTVQDSEEMIRTPFFIRDGRSFKLIYFPSVPAQRISFMSKYIRPIFRPLALYNIAREFRSVLSKMKFRIFHGGRLLPSRELFVDYKAYKDPPSPEVKEAWDIVRFLIGAIKDLAKKNNSRFAVVTIPQALEVIPDELKSLQAYFPEARDMTWNLKGPEKTMENILDKEGVPHLSLSSIFIKRFRGGERPYWPCDGHFNITGHMWAGEAIYEFLVEKRLTARETN